MKRLTLSLPVILISFICCAVHPAAGAAEMPKKQSFQADDEEFREIKRLRTVVGYETGTVTNTAAVEQYQMLVQKRQQRYLDEVQGAKDAVAVLVKMSQDPFVDPPINELAKYWNDPRAEQALETLSKIGSRQVGYDVPTPAAVARTRLAELRARKQLESIVLEERSEQERTAAIIAFLNGRADLAQPYPTPLEKAVLASMLFGELTNSTSSNAVGLVLRSGQFRTEYAQKHFQEMLELAQRLTPDEAVANPKLVAALFESGNKAVILLLEKWLPAVRDRGQKSYFESAIRKLKRNN